MKEATQRASKPQPAPENEPQKDRCELRVEVLRAQQQLPGTPVFDENRGHILARARAQPLLFADKPQFEKGTLNDKQVLLAQKYRKALLETKQPISEIQQILRKTRRDYPLRRAIFLSQQYFYAEQTLLALRLSQILRLDHLFDEPQIQIKRGQRVLDATLEEGRYYLPPDVPEGAAVKKKQHGPSASLLLFDRVKLKEQKWGQELAFDLSNLQRELGFEQAHVLAKTEHDWAFELKTQGILSHAVVRMSAGKEPTIVCESPPEDAPQQLAVARKKALRRQELIDPAIAAAHEIIARGLPFDEPRTEEGQQDGLLRIHFRKAYRSYESTYEFNGDRYYVFDGFGRPRLPEVCIDFITDAFDWGSGGHWPVRGEKRLQKKGALNFSSWGIENPRSIESLAEFATATPEWFDMLWIEKKDQIQYRHRERFFDRLLETADRYQRGDVVFIYGLRDDDKFHYHSFIIDEKDPVTGIPMVVLANAGPPQARSWEGEMQNAPLRAIVARMRLRTSLLEAAQEQQEKHPGEPLKAPIRPEGSLDGEIQPL